MFDDIFTLEGKEDTENNVWMDIAAEYARSRDYYTGLLDEISKNFGIESYTSDDGSIQDSPLRAKMPELVKKLKFENIDFLSRIEVIKEMLGIQCQHGNWNYDPYMHGMANGIIFALSVMTNEDPHFLDAPEKWLCDKTVKGEDTDEIETR